MPIICVVFLLSMFMVVRVILVFVSVVASIVVVVVHVMFVVVFGIFVVCMRSIVFGIVVVCAIVPVLVLFMVGIVMVGVSVWFGYCVCCPCCLHVCTVCCVVVHVFCQARDGFLICSRLFLS